MPTRPTTQAENRDSTKLDSESYFERCEGQAVFERKGRDGGKELADAASSTKLAPPAFAHALWALAQTDGAEGDRMTC